MKFDFNTLQFETLDGSSNSTPDIYFNQNGLTFSRRVLEDLGYPAQVLCQLDAKTVFSPSVLAGATIPKYSSSQSRTKSRRPQLCLSNKNLIDTLR